MIKMHKIQDISLKYDMHVKNGDLKKKTRGLRITTYQRYYLLTIDLNGHGLDLPDILPRTPLTM